MERGVEGNVRINLDRSFDRTASAASASGRRPIGPPHYWAAEWTARLQEDVKWTLTEKGNSPDIG
uniref:Uncharacterized protein n=1 Tax=Oryza meridionalis TaxID=40149 RepID=A0A0E0EQE3_9ORYZ